MNAERLLQLAAWHDDRADAILDRMQAHRWARPVFICFEGTEIPDELEIEQVKLIEAQRALAAINRKAAAA